MSKEERISGFLLYAGVRRTTSGGISHKYHEVDENEKYNEDNYNLYRKKLTRGAVGSIIRVEFSRDKQTTYWDKSTVPFSLMKDKETMISWRAISEAIELEERTKKQLINTITKNDLNKNLEPIRDSYRELNHADRACLLANVIKYITS